MDATGDHYIKQNKPDQETYKCTFAYSYVEARFKLGEGGVKEERRP